MFALMTVVCSLASYSALATVHLFDKCSLATDERLVVPTSDECLVMQDMAAAAPEKDGKRTFFFCVELPSS